MKMGEFIKRIFNHKKQELLESSTRKEEKTKFDEKLRVDVKHTGNLVVNNLKALGVREEFLKNTEIINEIQKHINAVISQSDMENWQGLEASYTKEQIEDIKNVMQSSGISDDEKMLLADDEKSEQKYGIKMDSDTGSITLQKLNKEEENYIQEDKYFLEENGNLVISYEAFWVSEEEGEKMKNVEAIYKETYNPKGMQIKSDHIDYDIYMIQENQEIIEREDPPYIAKREIRRNGTWQTSYHIINLENLSKLSSYNFQDKNLFDTKEEALHFYEKNKRRFDTILASGRE